MLTTNANLFTLLGKVQAPWRFDRTSVNLVCMPLFHIAGCEWALAGMEVGAASILVRDFDPAQILDLMQAEGVTNALFVPAMLGFMARVPGAEASPVPGVALHRLWRFADHQRDAAGGHARVQMRVRAGLRHDRDDRRHHRADRGRP